ncbi:MAG: PQQ-dependent sugar dehydrogenase [Myxococcales bacterium]
MRAPLLLVALCASLPGCATPTAEAVPDAGLEHDAGELPGDGPDGGLADADGGTAPCELSTGGWGPAGTVAVRAEQVTANLEVPWSLAFPGNGEILIAERPGRIRLFRNGQLVATPVATVPNVASGGEGGLLGLVLHPDFATNRQFYVYFTSSVTGGGRINRVQRWVLAPDHNSASFEKLILDDIPGAVVHDGGRLRIGPDRMLYVGTGDAQQPTRSQDPTSVAGKLLRLTLEGEVPADNPTPGSPVFVSGIRNTQGFDFVDAKALYVSDHGPSGEGGRRAHDEVNFARPGDNLGWPTIYACETAPGLVTPSLTFSNAAPPGGLAIYRGTAVPEWRDSVLVATLGARHLQRVAFDPADRRRVVLHEVYFQGEPPGGFGRLREAVMGPDGHLYVTTSNCDGRGNCPSDKDRILRILK